MGFMAIGRRLAAALLCCLLTGPAQAGWREDLGVFRIGMVASPGSGAVVEGATAIRDAYARALGMPVEIFVARDYAALIDAQASSRIEYAIHSAASYAAAWRLCSCVEPVASPVSDDGSTGIRSILIARSGGPASSDDLAASRVAWGPGDSVSSYLMPLAEFTSNGQALQGNEPFLVAAASEAETERMLVQGSVDAMFGYIPSSADAIAQQGGSLARLAEAGGTGLTVLWTSELLRHGPHAVRTKLDGEAKDALRLFLTGLRDGNPKVYDLLERRFGGGFQEAVHEDYRTAIDLVRSAAARHASR